MTQCSPRAAVDWMEPGRWGPYGVEIGAARCESSDIESEPAKAPFPGGSGEPPGPDGRLARRERGPGCLAGSPVGPVRAGRRVGFIWARRMARNAVLASTGRNRGRRRTRSACPGRACMLVPPTHRFWFSALGSRFHSMMSRPHWPTRAAAAAGALQFFAGRRGRSAGNAK
jgi:hypothetical protein